MAQPSSASIGLQPGGAQSGGMPADQARPHETEHTEEPLSAAPRAGEQTLAVRCPQSPTSADDELWCPFVLTMRAFGDLEKRRRRALDSATSAMGLLRRAQCARPRFCVLVDCGLVLHPGTAHPPYCTYMRTDPWAPAPGRVIHRPLRRMLIWRPVGLRA